MVVPHFVVPSRLVEGQVPFEAWTGAEEEHLEEEGVLHLVGATIRMRFP